MTLTHLLPSLRRTLPDPLTPDLWPAHTSVTTTDVIVAGVSLSRLVDLCATPCVHTAAAVARGTRGRPSDSEVTPVLLTRVTAMGRTRAGGLEVWVDARLDDCAPVLAEARLLGRASTAHDRDMHIVGAPQAGVAQVPGDLRAGDVLAIPCAGGTCLHDLRADDEGEPPAWNRCAR